MKSVLKNLAVAALFTLPLATNVMARGLVCPGGVSPVADASGNLSCPATAVPEPSTPMLFLGAAGVAFAARALRNRKK